jgi:hypothetical protein
MLSLCCVTEPAVSCCIISIELSEVPVTDSVALKREQVLHLFVCTIEQPEPKDDAVLIARGNP